MYLSLVLNSPPCCLKQLCVKLGPEGLWWVNMLGNEAWQHSAPLAKVMQSAKLLHMCNVSHNCSFVDAAHEDHANAMWCPPWALEVSGEFLRIFFLPSCQHGQMIRGTGMWLHYPENKLYFGPNIILLGYKELIKMRSVPKSLWLLSDGQPGAARPVEPGQESTSGAGS